MDDLRTIQQVSARRSERWHAGAEPWSGADWGNAMGGECGEAQNVIKKLRRLETRTLTIEGRKSCEICDPLGIPCVDHPVHNAAEVDEQALRAKLGEELADTILYAVLVADHYGIDLATSVVAKFNLVSAESGFPERIG